MYRRIISMVEAQWNKPIPHTRSFLCECDNCILIDRKRMKKIMKELRNE